MDSSSSLHPATLGETPCWLVSVFGPALLLRLLVVLSCELLHESEAGETLDLLLCCAVRYQRDTVKELAEGARRAVDMSSNAARPR